MKRFLFLFLCSLLLGSGLIYWTAQQQSYVLVSIGNWSLETSVWFALGVLIAAALVVVVIRGILVGGWRGARGQVGRLLQGGSARSQRNTSKGLVSFIEGNWRVALRLLTKTADKSPAPILNYLAAARCAYELGDEQQANEWLAKAEALDVDAELAIALSQARIQFLGRKYEACAATLQRARKKAQDHPVVLDLLRKVLMKLQDWNELEDILPALHRYQVLDEDGLKALEIQIFENLLQQNAPIAGSEAQIVGVWKRVPKRLRAEPSLLCVYVDLLINDDQMTQAESLIRKTLQNHWDDALIIRYGLLNGGNVEQRLLFAEDWLKERPSNGQLMLTLGRLSMRNQLWGKARDYFSGSIKIQPTPEACAEMARLLASLGEHKTSTEYYQQGLLLTAKALPALPQP